MFASEYAGVMLAQIEMEEIDALEFSPTVGEFLSAELPERMALRREAVAVYDALKAFGFVVYVDHGSLKVEPDHLLSPELRSRVYSLPIRRYLEDACDEFGEAEAGLSALQSSGG